MFKLKVFNTDYWYELGCIQLLEFCEITTSYV